MTTKRKSYNANFKAKVALEAIKEEQTIAQISSKYRIDASQVTRWKREALDNLSSLFTVKKDKELSNLKKDMNILYKQIGKITIQNEFLQEKLNL